MKNFVLDIGLLLMFIYGVTVATPAAAWALAIALGLYTGLIIVSLVLPSVPPALIFEQKVSLQQLHNILKLGARALSVRYRIFNIIVDLTVAGIMFYFNYPVLAVFFILHIMGYLIFYKNIKLYMLGNFNETEWNQVPARLVEALEQGQEEFTLPELAKYNRKDSEDSEEPKKAKEEK